MSLRSTHWTAGPTPHSVSQRRHEIGIRMALGAQTGQVLRRNLQQALALALAGLALGLALAQGVTRLMAGLLYGVGTTDVPYFCVRDSRNCRGVKMGTPLQRRFGKCRVLPVTRTASEA